MKRLLGRLRAISERSGAVLGALGAPPWISEGASTPMEKFGPSARKPPGVLDHIFAWVSRRMSETEPAAGSRKTLNLERRRPCRRRAEAKEKEKEEDEEEQSV